MLLETSIILRGREVKLKPSHKAIFQTEDQTGKATVDLFLGGNLKVKDACHLLHNCAVAAGEDITFDEMGELLIGRFDAAVATKCNELLASVFQSSTEKKKQNQSTQEKTP